MHVETHVFRLDRLFKELNNVIEQIVVSETENEKKSVLNPNDNKALIPLFCQNN